MSITTWDYSKVFSYYPELNTYVINPIYQMIATAQYNIPMIMGVMMQVVAFAVSMREVHPYLRSTWRVKVERLDNSCDYLYKYRFNIVDKPYMVVMQAGNKVDHTAYAKFAHDLTAKMRGKVFVVLPQIKYGMAYVEPADPNRFYDMFEDDINGWFLGGHSAGAQASTIYKAEEFDILSNHTKPLKGLFLIASLPKANLTTKDIPIKYVLASEDPYIPWQTIITPEWQAQNCPPEDPLTKAGCSVSVIPGANHEQFAYYHSNFPSSPSNITRSEQTRQTVNLIKDWIESIIE